MNSLYRVSVAHLDPFQLVLVGTVLELSTFLFEIPTGLVADLKSRRLSIIIGVYLIGAGFILEGSLPVFVPILVAQCLWGIGWTFTSGALQAWISDEIGEELAPPAFIRGAKLGQVGSFIGVVLGTTLGTVSLNLPIILSGCMFWMVGFYLILVMPENGFKPVPHENRTTFQSMAQTLRLALNMARRRPALRGILAVGFVLGLYSEGFDRLWVAHVIGRFNLPYFQPVVWIGFIQGGAMLLSAVFLHAVEKRLDLKSMPALVKALIVLVSGILLCLVAFAFSPWFGLVVILFWTITIFREISSPIYTAWVNYRLDSSVRATVLSTSSQMDALGQVAGGPLIGFIARQISIPIGLLVSAIFLSPSLILLRRSKSEETQ